MIEQYALEEKTKVEEDKVTGLKTGGEPTGKFWMNQSAARAAALEISSLTTWIPTSPRPGVTSMSTRPVSLRSS